MTKAFFIIFISTVLHPILSQANDHTLLNIQKKIYDARDESFKQKDYSPLQTLIIELDQISNPPNTHWKEYWTAYALYQSSIYYAYGPNKDEKKGEGYVDKAIKLLDSVKDKNSEDYALLGMMKGYSLQWKSFFSMAKESSIAGKWVEKAVKMDDQNPRAHYTYGNNNYFTPKMFGGGKKADEYLTTALQLYKESIPNPMMPSWGEEDTYNKLIRTKLKNDKKEEAKMLLSEAKKAFPNGREINSITID